MLAYCSIAPSSMTPLAIAHEYVGMLNFDEGKDTDAKREFEHAYQLDSTAYLSLFFKTMMSPAA